MIGLLERRLWSAEEYHQMAEAGILNDDDRLELIEGEIIRMSPVGVRHVATVNRINQLLSFHFFNRAIVSPQNPVRLNDLSEPEPDLVLLKFKKDTYVTDLPTAGDVLLLIEVSDSTLAYDRNVKRPLYARSGVPEYWIMNLIDNVIEVHREPEGDGYKEMFRVSRNSQISAVAFPEVTFQVEDLIR